MFRIYILVNVKSLKKNALSSIPHLSESVLHRLTTHHRSFEGELQVSLVRVPRVSANSSPKAARRSARWSVSKGIEGKIEDFERLNNEPAQLPLKSRGCIKIDVLIQNRINRSACLKINCVVRALWLVAESSLIFLREWWRNTPPIAILWLNSIFQIIIEYRWNCFVRG